MAGAELSPLFEAIARDDAAAVEVLGPAALAERDPTGASPLLHAIYRGKSAVIAALRIRADLFEAAALGDLARVESLATPAGVAALSGDGFTALHLAAFFGHEAVVVQLLARGADPRAVARNPMRVTALHSAVANRDAAVAHAIAVRLLDAGADPSCKQHGDWTPLHQAAAHGNGALVAELLARGADRQALATGRTPAEMATGAAIAAFG